MAAQGLGEAGGGVHGRAEDSRAAEVGIIRWFGASYMPYVINLYKLYTY